ncbi:mitochondrial carrier domain-containing protein [Phascolomyces articulosus]|uniref:Mitochondrial carrier domain-containing protein n=1 Tax=Phascolomyces articulosus TaxID=60185 RepID=A0AAD5K3E7_9FUNG|nr:mitochondrial carrier domain-containing protein [Phascolomyces articulosus]
MFKGILAPVIGLAGLNAVLFVSYGSILRAFEKQHIDGMKSLDLLQENHTSNYVPTLTEVYLAGFGAGVAGFLFSAPTELVKIKDQVSRVPKGSWQIIKEILVRDGFRGLYQGGWITIIRDAPSYGVYFWVYEGMKRLLETDAGKSNAWQLLLAGGTAGVVSWSSIYPIDVVKSRLQMQVVPPARVSSTAAHAHHSNSPVRPYTSIKDCVIRSYQAEGTSVFFRGLGPAVLRAFPVNAVTFFTYEWMMDMLGR